MDLADSIIYVMHQQLITGNPTDNRGNLTQDQEAAIFAKDSHLLLVLLPNVASIFDMNLFKVFNKFRHVRFCFYLAVLLFLQLTKHC